MSAGEFRSRAGRISIVGVPSSAGSYAAGQDQAPAALRSAGLVEALAQSGVEVHDDGDLPVQIWAPDRAHSLVQNLSQVTLCLQELTERLVPLFARGDNVLVLGGGCMIALGVHSALLRMDQGAPGLLYVDRHFDLNTPESTTDGALDWMGMAHALALPGCIDVLADALGPRPLLEPHQVAWLGIDPRMCTEWEHEQAARLNLRITSSDAFAADPSGTAYTALGSLPAGPLAVHLDVDVLDFTDAPLAENTDGRNTGPTLSQVSDALSLAARDRRFRALSIGELNPTRSVGDPGAISRFVSAITDILSGSPH
jgi:arginase